MSGILDLSLATPTQPVTAATVVLDLSVLGKIVQVRIKAAMDLFSIVIYSEQPQCHCNGMNAIDAEMFLRRYTPMTGEAARLALQAATSAAMAMTLTPVI